MAKIAACPWSLKSNVTVRMPCEEGVEGQYYPTFIELCEKFVQVPEETRAAHLYAKLIVEAMRDGARR